MARATIEDVARRAGVTKSTVSHALSGKRPVSEETRRRIDTAIAALGYRPNPVAQRLAVGRSGAIGLVYPLRAEDVGGVGIGVLTAVSEAVAEAGFAFVLLSLVGANAATLRPLIESGSLDGVILGQVQMHDERVAILRQLGGPLVMLGRTADNSGLNFVDVDVDAAVEACVEHVIGLGHRRLALFYEGAQASAQASRCLQAYERACARRRLRIQALFCPPTPVGARTVAADVLRQHRDLTALIVSGDFPAFGAHQAGLEIGRRIPEDLSLVCLGRTRVSEMLGLRVTGVDLRPEQQARQAVAMLLQLLGASSDGDAQVLLEPGWVSGETTASTSETD